MHPEAAQFVRSCRQHFPTGAVVYEVGSLNVNGQARDLIGGIHTWTGIDLIDGPGVELPGDAVDLLPNMDLADVVVCCEVLEHYQAWPVLVHVMCQVLKPGGALILTCAGTGRPPHAADGSTGGPHAGEFYSNVSLSELEAVMTGMTKVFGNECLYPGDTHYIGRRDDDI